MRNDGRQSSPLLHGGKAAMAPYFWELELQGLVCQQGGGPAPPLPAQQWGCSQGCGGSQHRVPLIPRVPCAVCMDGAATRQGPRRAEKGPSACSPQCWGLHNPPLLPAQASHPGSGAHPAAGTWPGGTASIAAPRKDCWGNPLLLHPSPRTIRKPQTCSPEPEQMDRAPRADRQHRGTQLLPSPAKP